MIELKCPHCGHQLRVRSKYAGKQGQCKHCNGFVDVPNTYTEMVKRESADAPTRPVETPKSPVAGTALADLIGDDSTAAPPKPPVEATSLEDLIADDAPGGVKPTVPMAPDALDDMLFAQPPVDVGPEYKRLGLVYWVLVVLVAPVALVQGLRLPSGHPQKRRAILAPIVFAGAVVAVAIMVFVGPAVPSLTMFSTGTNPDAAESSTSERPIENERPAAVSAEDAMAYAQTRLPSYPGLVFSTADLSENVLTGPLANADPAELTTFVGTVNVDYETVSNYFHTELRNRGWSFDDFDYGNAANGEIYILGRHGGHGIEYRTSVAGGRTRVVITHGPIAGGN